MKKRLLSILMAICLMFTTCPTVFAADTTMDESTFRNAVEKGGTVIMTGDVTLTKPLTITKGVTIDGTSNKYSIDYNGGSHALAVNTNESVRLQNLEINATANNGRGINLDSNSPKLYLTGTTMNVNNRGISFMQAGDAFGAFVSLDQSHILNSRVTGNYDQNTTIGDLRGISLFDSKKSTITLKDSSIKGFGYCINLTGTKNPITNTVDLQKTKVNLIHSDLFGWSTLNVWSSNTEFNINGSHLRGINPSYGILDSFATIVVNDDIYDTNDQFHADACTFKITNSLIDNFIPADKLEHQKEQGDITVEFLFRIDSRGVTRAEMTDVTFMDTTDVLPCAFIAGNGRYDQAFYNYVMGNMVTSGKTPFDWKTAPVSTYSDGKTSLPLVIGN